ncbi:hypothetical protein P7C73_g4084, partial [Tremellales sp. Uapishka_1]
MAPIALTSSLTSPPGLPVGKSQIASVNKDQGMTLDSEGTNTPLSTSSTAVSESGQDKKAIIDDNLPSNTLAPSDSDYFTSILASSLPTPSSKSGSTVFASAIDVLQAFAAHHSDSIWVYDDALQVGFGNRLLEWEQVADKINSVQTRSGAGLELAGYATKTKGLISVFATTSTLPYLLDNIASIKSDIIIHLATTAPSETLELSDSLLSANILKSLASLPEDWQVVFSAGKRIVDDAGALYAHKGKVINVVESTFSGREISSFLYPSTASIVSHGFSVIGSDDELLAVPSGHLSASLIAAGKSVLVVESLSPDADQLSAALAGKTVTALGGSKADVEALQSILLATLYSASRSSKAVLPSIKSRVVTSVSDVIAVPDATQDAKTISFYTPPTSPLPQLLAHLFLSSPTLKTQLAQFGSASARGVKSVLSLSQSSAKTASLSVDERSDVVWVSDANIIKTTNVLAGIQTGGVLVLELPWSEEEVPVKISGKDIATIQEKNIRVFLLDLDASSSLSPIREQVAFLLLYTGQQILPTGVKRVLDAFYSGNLHRDEIEDAQASLSEIAASDVAKWDIPVLEEGKVEKEKSAWEWDALPGQAGVVSVNQDEKPVRAGWDLAARHLLFREAFAVPEAKLIDHLPAVATLRPSTPDETFLVKVTENRRLTPQKYDRNVFHLELDSSGTGLKYDIGEAIGIHGWNDDAEVLDFCSWYGLVPDQLVSFLNPLKAGTMETRTIFQLLQQNLDLFGKPGKAFYASLSKVATAIPDAMTLKFISAPEGAELFKKMAELETVTFADVLKRFKTARPSIEELVGLIPEIKPRHYSIASSQKAVGDKVELLIVTVDWVDSKGSPRYGQCTRYLAALAPGAQVTVSIKPSVMKLPPDDRQPIIMAGLGTGAAPFRAFMQHRAWQKAQGIEVGPLIYYFGSRYRSQEYLYGEEIEAYIASGIIAHAGLAFSRDGKDKMYIQHKMKQDKKMLAKYLMGKGPDAAYFYLCGPTWPVPDVFEALVSSLSEEGGKTRQAAEEYIEELKEEERYVLEVYPSGPIESTHCLYETVESLNTQLYPSLQKLVNYPFFRHYKVDLYRECPFWYENGFCMNRACGVEAADESEIPEKWRAKALSEVKVSNIESDGIQSCYFREQDFCYIEDDATEDGQYIDLSLNPERFTGYAGDSAQNVWRAIYEENCFGLSEAAVEASSGNSVAASAVVGAGGISQPNPTGGAGGFGFSKLSEGWGTEMIKSVEDAMCEEKKVYYRVISGLHASISIHICHDYMDQQTGEWAPNLQCFINRLATHPERLSNVYFNAVLLMRAVARAAPYLEAYDIGTAPTALSGECLDAKGLNQREVDNEAKESLKEVLALAGGDQLGKGFDEGDFFTGPDAIVLKEQFKTHFRNVSRIMDCVGCDKCRLWGKLQVSGLGTALKILFELDEKALDPKVNPDLLQRSEVVALFNTLHRISESLAGIDDFRKIYARTQAVEEKAAKERKAERERSKRPQPPANGGRLYVLAIISSAVEGLRRFCRGSIEYCSRGSLGDLLALLGRHLGGLVGRTEL